MFSCVTVSDNHSLHLHIHAYTSYWLFSVIYHTFKKRKCQYFGHIIRGDGVQRLLMEGRINGRRERGRPRTMWTDNIKEWTKMSYNDCIRVAQDRERWRSMTADLLTTDGTKWWWWWYFWQHLILLSSTVVAILLHKNVAFQKKSSHLVVYMPFWKKIEVRREGYVVPIIAHHALLTAPIHYHSLDSLSDSIGQPLYLYHQENYSTYWS